MTFPIPLLAVFALATGCGPTAPGGNAGKHPDASRTRDGRPSGDGLKPIDGGAEGPGSIDAASRPDGATCTEGLCTSGQTCCGTVCVSIQLDPSNCGACGHKCAAGLVCSAGACVCPSTMPMACGSACVNTQTDPANCGGCGMSCGTGCACVSGACSCPTCGGGLTLCGGACTDTQTSSANCGGCGKACPAGSTCTGGACVCPSTTPTACGLVCVNTQTDLANCGGCGKACTSGESCVAGTCVCNSGATMCSGMCINPQTDPANCGGCGIKCPSGASCSAGKCSLTCPTPQMQCGTSPSIYCADVSSDPSNCGTCGKTCASGQTCASGACGCPGDVPTVCSGVCTNVESDPNNCSACGSMCGTGQVCAAGGCGTPTLSPAAAPTARESLAVVAGPDGLIYLFGGNASTLYGEVDAYDPATNTWNSSLPALPTPRSNLAAAMGQDGLIYVVGGTTGVGSALTTVEAFNTGTRLWKTASALGQLATGRYGLAAAAGPDGRVYAIGGLDAGHNILGSVEAYSYATNAWTAVAPLNDPRGFRPCAATTKGLLYVIGGYDASGVSNENEAYDPKSNTWSFKSNLITAREELACAVGSDGHIYAIGGDDAATPIANAYATLEDYSPSGNIWFTDSPMPAGPRMLLGAAAGPGASGLVYAVDGENSTGPLTRVEAFSVKMLTW